MGTIVVARPYLVQIQSPDGRYVTLALHKGTVINPLGTTLAPGMHIAAHGIPRSDGDITTDEVDLQGPGLPGPRGGPIAPGGGRGPRPPGNPGPPAPAGPRPR